MFSHIILGARDLIRLGNFYDVVLGELEWHREPSEDDGGPEGILWIKGENRMPQFWIQLPWNGLPATWSNGSQLSFLATSTQQVDKGYTAAMKAGGIDEGGPGYRPNYGDNYYGAYFRDPEGNKLCLVHGMA